MQYSIGTCIPNVIREFIFVLWLFIQRGINILAYQVRHKFHPIPSFDPHMLKPSLPNLKGSQKEPELGLSNLLTNKQTNLICLIFHGTDKQITLSQPIIEREIQKQDSSNWNKTLFNDKTPLRHNGLVLSSESKLLSILNDVLLAHSCEVFILQHTKLGHLEV